MPVRGTTTPLHVSHGFAASGEQRDLEAAHEALKRAYSGHQGVNKVYPWGQWLLQCVADAVAQARREGTDG